MEDVLLAPEFATGEADLLDLVDRLRHEVAELRQEVADLRRENFELRQQAGFWKAQHGRAVQREEQAKAEVERLHAANRQLQHQIFGRKSEQWPANHLEGDETEPTEPTAPPRRRGQQKDRPGPSRRDNQLLPVRDEIRTLPAAQQVCAQCGQALTPSGTEDSEQLEIEVKAYRRRIRRRRYQRTCRCSGCPRTVTAPLPPKLIPKGRLGVSVWVEVLLDKYFSHRPTERLLTQWRLLGLDVAAGTVTDGLQRLEPLFEPLYQALLARNALSKYAQADETRWPVFIVQEGKTGHCWWLWMFLGEDTVVFRLDPHRSHDVPEGHFAADARVVLMVDRYAAYKAMAQVKLGHIVLAFCWAHVRRDFIKVAKHSPQYHDWALTWLRHIRDLYRQQRLRQAHRAGTAAFADADTALRQRLQVMQTQTAEELADPGLNLPKRQALDSLQAHWTGLTRFVDDLRIPLDNNASERQQRGPVVGRKNYYGSGALWSGRLAAMLFTLFATLGMWQLNPRQWLTWFLQSCAEAGGQAPADITPFLPWNLSAERRQEMASEPRDSS
jgi:transposase